MDIRAARRIAGHAQYLAERFCGRALMEFHRVLAGFYGYLVLLTATRVKDKGRAEACDAGAGRAPHAQVHDSVRSFEEKFVRKRLRAAITLRNRIGLQADLPLRRVKRVKPG